MLTTARHLWLHGRTFHDGLHEAKNRVFLLEIDGLKFMYDDEPPVHPWRVVRWACQEIGEWIGWRLGIGGDVVTDGDFG